MKHNNKLERQLQRYFSDEYAKGIFERILRSDFDFSRSITEVHPDKSFAARLLRRVEDHYLLDFILVDSNHTRVSAVKDNPLKIQNSEVMRRLKTLSALKQSGKRIFFVTHHEGYVGPYAVRSALQRLGFDDLAGKCNTVVGPRMRSNIVLKMISGNSGNTFMVLPSSKTRPVKNKLLEKALLKCSLRTRALIKLPNNILDMIEESDFKTFMQRLPALKRESIANVDPALGNHLEILHASLTEADFNSFRRIMREPYMMFPEGTRSLVDRDGNVTLKYFSPRYIASYMRPGDVMVPLSLVGGSDALQGIRFRHARFGLSVGDVIDVNQETITNSDLIGVEVMKKVAALPNIKQVCFSEEIQFAERHQNHKTSRKKTA